MLEIKITAPELSEAINNLAKAMTARAETTLSGKTSGAIHTSTTSVPANRPTEQYQTAPAPAESVANPAAPISAPQTVPTAQSTPSVSCPTDTTPPAPTVPTAAPQYNLETIAKAGTALIDAGKMGDLMSLLSKYNVEALTSLDPSQYGVFASELRALGAAI